MSADLWTSNGLLTPNLMDPSFVGVAGMRQWAVTALAQTGSAAERLWLLGGVALALTGAGVVALAAARGGRD
ncbi:hypothetical protein [Streptomyces corynorhini]|uniref:hypothetical protein n=1 Tax=Streptomyces corynorhini TaxID=2282652 RepID=UPI0011C0516F|nr:hypothetical protein [Streptomyces corynorhini]